MRGGMVKGDGCWGEGVMDIGRVSWDWVISYWLLVISGGR